ncbi:MAG: alpha/beta fold hydrolase [Myxococcota bacterium]
MKFSREELNEILTYLRHTYHRQGNTLKVRDFYDRVKPDEPPVLLIHGFLGTRGAMYPMELRLRKDQFTVFSINLGLFNVGDIRRSAYKIHTKIKRILREVEMEKIDIVGHSMGGLIGLYYIKKLSGNEHVRKLITLGTPHRGTWTTLLGIATLGVVSPSVWQLLPNNFFLRELQAAPLPDDVAYYSIAGSYDVVCPPLQCVLPGASSIELPCGHAALATSTQVYEVVREILLDNFPKNSENGSLS